MAELPRDEHSSGTVKRGWSGRPVRAGPCEVLPAADPAARPAESSRALLVTPVPVQVASCPARSRGVALRPVPVLPSAAARPAEVREDAACASSAGRLAVPPCAAAADAGPAAPGREVGPRGVAAGRRRRDGAGRGTGRPDRTDCARCTHFDRRCWQTGAAELR